MGSKHISRITAAVTACIIAFSALGANAFAENALYYEPTGESADFVGASLVFSKSTITLEEAQEPQYITLYAKSPNNTPFESTGLHILFDDDMEILPIDSHFHDYYAECLLSGGSIDALDMIWHSVFICTASSSQYTASAEGTPYCRVKVKLKDPEPGKKYNVTIAYRENDLFTSAFSANDAKIQDYAFSHVEPGYIMIEDTPEESSIAEAVEEICFAEYTEGEICYLEDDNDSKVRLSDTDSEASSENSESLSSVPETSNTESSVSDGSSEIPSSSPDMSDSESSTEPDSKVSDDSSQAPDSASENAGSVSSTEPDVIESKVPDDSSQTPDCASENADSSSSTKPDVTESKASDESSETQSKTPDKPAEPKPSEVKPERSILKGDANGDGAVDIEDAVAAVNFINGTAVLSDEMIVSADIDMNGAVDVEDVAAIINHINGVKVLDN